MSTAGIFQEDRTAVLSTGGDQRLHSLRGVFLRFLSDGSVNSKTKVRLVDSVKSS